MAETTEISWADSTVSFWIGCTKVSPACDHCYAERDWDKRKHRVEWGPHGPRSQCVGAEKTMAKIARKALPIYEQTGYRHTVFVNSLSDTFDNHSSISEDWRVPIWRGAEVYPQLRLLLVTKRPQNIERYVPRWWQRFGNWPVNVAVLVTAENQFEAERRSAVLLPLAKRWGIMDLGLSMEPLLEPVNLRRLKLDGLNFTLDALTARGDHLLGDVGRTGRYNWVIVGGESGPKARYTDPDIFRYIRDQCADAGVAFHMKQMTSRKPVPEDLQIREFPW